MANCYYGPNMQSTKTVPCNHTALDNGGHTQCCEPGDLCLTNGLCREETVDNSTNYAWRFGCTDREFKDPACGTAYCDHITDSDTHLTWKCPEDNKWCCNTGFVGPPGGRANRTNETCCTIDDLLFTAENPVVFGTAKLYTSKLPVSTLQPVPSGASNATFSPSSAMITSATSTFTANSSAAGGSENGASPLAIGLGAGLGSVAAIALGLGSFLVWRRRKRNIESPRSETPAKELSDHGPVEGDDRTVAEMRAGGHRVELTSPVSPVELWTPADRTRAELPGEEKGRTVIGEVHGESRH